jgi:hypothetical protein
MALMMKYPPPTSTGIPIKTGITNAGMRSSIVLPSDSQQPAIHPIGFASRVTRAQDFLCRTGNLQRRHVFWAPEGTDMERSLKRDRLTPNAAPATAQQALLLR